MYEDGRFAFKSDAEWTAGSYVILRTDERQKGVLRLEYYVDGNLHLQEVRCEIYFAEQARDGSDEAGARASPRPFRGQRSRRGQKRGTTMSTCRVEVLPSAEQSLDMAGHFLHQHQ